MHINKFLDILKSKLPEICTDKDLVLQLPSFFKSPCTITRLRSQGRCPPHFYVKPHIYYLKDDVIAWLKEQYKPSERSIQPVKSPSNRSCKPCLTKAPAK